MPLAQSYAEAKSQVEHLVQRFARNLDTYKRPEYKETQVRVEFIDPLFEALGWDVRNTKGYAEQYKDVIHEDALKVSGAVRAPDYCFRIGGTRKFFLEAKKPSVSVKGDVGPAYQLRRYAWSAKLPLSILTDFEEFAVYDCQRRPKPSDKAGVGRVLYFTFDQYPHCLDEVYGILARQSVLEGSFDRYVQDTKRQRGTSEVDTEFLKEIEGWREALARNLALRNPALTVHELNFAVQRTIDRIIFLRMAEDRGIEAYGRLLALTGGPHIYPRLAGELYRQADEKYDSGLFDFQADTLTRSLAVDDRALKPILAGLYYPDCPYEFSVLPAEVLGQVYEQFLGRVIRLTPAHRAVVEEKPEVKKAGGVYYTPSYIVEYIVGQTVGKLVENKSPRQLRGTRSRPPLRVLDPACGSGSFLLGAYQHLLDHYRRWYEENDPEKHAASKEPAVYQGPGGGWRLTTAEKKRILLDHIYGVDIDRQAVEVTKLSLLLKVLEGETDETLGQQLRLWRERALPDLDGNIKCGNSLIGPDYFEGRLLPDEEEVRRVNPFDWEAEFPEAMAAGGFDAVIGNPPYIGFHGFKDTKSYLRDQYASATGRFDVYLPFLEKGLAVLIPGGLLGYICPTNFTKRGHGRALREILKSSITIVRVLDFQDVQIFENALNYTGIFVFEKTTPSMDHRFEYAMRALDAAGYQVLQRSLQAQGWVFHDERSEEFVQKIRSLRVVQLGRLSSDIAEGIVTGKNDVFLLERETVRKLSLEEGVVKLCARGRQVRRYHIEDVTELVIYPYVNVPGQTIALSADQMAAAYPRAWEYLQSRRQDLAGRGYFDRSSKAWYELWCPRTIEAQSAVKILVPELAETNRFALADTDLFYGDTVCGITLRESVRESMLYVLGILNSSLLEYFYKHTTVPKANRYYIYKTMFLKNLPVRVVNFDDPADVARHDTMVVLVERILDLHKKLAAATIPDEKQLYERQIEATDRQIDALVYELYDLTDEEIAIVEEATR